ncbi:MAG: hypothetical protein ACT4NK_06330 [Limnobacter sp.]|uniref:hypothetical protein n=1 Tax=Limnobacter sp. TaxID=2003368 RepID=UPI004037BEF5
MINNVSINKKELDDAYSVLNVVSVLLYIIAVVVVFFYTEYELVEDGNTSQYYLFWCFGVAGLIQLLITYREPNFVIDGTYNNIIKIQTLITLFRVCFIYLIVNYNMDFIFVAVLHLTLTALNLTALKLISIKEKKVKINRIEAKIKICSILLRHGLSTVIAQIAWVSVSTFAIILIGIYVDKSSVATLSLCLAISGIFHQLTSLLNQMYLKDMYSDGVKNLMGIKEAQKKLVLIVLMPLFVSIVAIDYIQIIWLGYEIQDLSLLVRIILIGDAVAIYWSVYSQIGAISKVVERLKIVNVAYSSLLVMSIWILVKNEAPIYSVAIVYSLGIIGRTFYYLRATKWIF